MESRAGRRQPISVRQPAEVPRVYPAEEPRTEASPWETVDPIQEWRENHKCVLCREYLPEGRRDFEAHVRSVHGAEIESARSLEKRIPCKTHCTWVCSVCKAEYYYPVVTKSVHSGPQGRSFDRRFAFGSCRHGRYPAHKRAFGKIDGASWPIVFFHEGLTFSEQPVQDDPSLAEFIKVKKPRAKREATIERAGRGKN